MIACVGIGTVTGTIFLVILLFVAGSISDITDSPAGPLLAILYNATSNKAGAVCLLMYESCSSDFVFFLRRNSDICLASPLSACCLLPLLS